ncbi:MAG: hypothetical protein IJP31_05505 [Lachnospiraceae bacterium]|nr:hypothetical protein [Lachnospiraceae bacterium]
MNNTDFNDIHPNYPRHETLYNSFSSASRILGILALVSMIFSMIYGAMIFGGLAIILAVLSKGYHNSLKGPALAGMICGCIAVIIETLIIAVSIYAIIFIPEVRQQFNTQYQQIYEQFYGNEPVDNPFDNLFNNTDIPRVEGGDL